MRKKTVEQGILARAVRRERKKRPRMRMHGASLRRSLHAAGRIIKARR